MKLKEDPDLALLNPICQSPKRKQRSIVFSDDCDYSRIPISRILVFSNLPITLTKPGVSLSSVKRCNFTSDFSDYSIFRTLRRSKNRDSNVIRFTKIPLIRFCEKKKTKRKSELMPVFKSAVCCCRRTVDLLSGSNWVKICRAMSLPHTSRLFVATNRVETLGKVIQNQDGAYSTDVTLMTFPNCSNWLSRARAPTNCLGPPHTSR